MIVGIDLGTTNSSASAILDGKPVCVNMGTSVTPYILPSVVGFDEGGNIIVGEKAKNQYILHPESTVKSVKSMMGTDHKIKLLNPKTDEYVIFTPFELSAKILEEIKKMASVQFATDIRQAVITVPAYFGDKARKDTIRAGELAGLEVVRIVNEPTAAALSYGLQNRKLKNHHIMVYDLGGGTFDISMLEINDDIIEVIASDGDRNLGGDNFDFALTTYISNRIKTVYNVDLRNDMKALAALVTESENCKKKLSSNIRHSIEITHGKIAYNEDFYRDHFEALIQNLLQKTLYHCKSVIEKSNIKREQVDKILLVGGSTRIPAVREMLENELKIQASQELDPELAVVTGAAIQAAIVEGRNVDSILVDVAPHSLSISCVMEKDGKVIPNYCNKLIKKNTPIPCTVEEVFSTLNDNQETVRIAIYQGESDFEEDNTLIEEIKFSGLKSRKAGDTQILLNFSYNLNGALEINVMEEGTDNLLKHNLNINKITRSSALTV